MKKPSWCGVLSLLFLAALSAEADAAGVADPIAYSCYFCSDDEMRQIAIAQGEGVHYVYDFDNGYITGYTVETATGVPIATRFDAEAWVQHQFASLARHYKAGKGVFTYRYRLDLYAPGSDHGMRASDGQFIKGHHLSALHPQNAEALRTMVRYLERNGDFAFLDTSDSGGRLLQLDVIRTQGYPVAAVLGLGSSDSTEAVFHFDYASHSWVFVEAYDILFDTLIQHVAGDFVRSRQPYRNVYYDYGRDRRWFADAFVERAGWAGVPIIGTMPPPGNVAVSFICSDETGAPVCTIK